MSINHLTLYHYPATRSARVRWILNELFEPDRFAIRRLDLYAGEQYAPDYVAKNPNHTVPFLEIDFEDGRSMTMGESAAMVLWLADAVPEKGLAPPIGLTPERADYLQAAQLAAGPMDMMLWQIRVHEHVLNADEKDEPTIARYRGKLSREIEPQLKARLKRADFICGDAFTAADILTGHCVAWARGYGQCQDRIFRRYLSVLSKRPAFIAAFDDVGEFQPQPPRDSALLSQFTG